MRTPIAMLLTLLALIFPPCALAEEIPGIHPEQQTVQTETLVMPQVQMLMGTMETTSAPKIAYEILWGESPVESGTVSPEMQLTLVPGTVGNTDVYYSLVAPVTVSLSVKNKSTAGAITDVGDFTGNIKVSSAFDGKTAEGNLTGIGSTCGIPATEGNEIAPEESSGPYLITYTQGAPLKWKYNTPSHEDESVKAALTSSITFTITPLLNGSQSAQ